MDARKVLRLSISLWLISAASHTNAAIGDQEFFVRCAAVYSALEQIHEGLGASERARISGERFQILGAEVEALFPDTKKGRSDARALVGVRLQEMLMAALINEGFFFRSEMICDAGFVEFQSR